MDTRIVNSTRPTQDDYSPTLGIKDTELEELIYTSAPSTLRSSTGHLGVVAQTKDFPYEIERQLARFWSYAMPSELQQTQAQSIPRYALVPVGGTSNAISLTRVQDAGVDHTGRTNLIAQHFVADMGSLLSHKAGVAELVAWAIGDSATKCFLDSWEGDPRFLNKQILPRIHEPKSPFAFLSENRGAWGLELPQLEEAVLSAVDALSEYRMKQKMVVVVLKPRDAFHVLFLLGAILSAIPKCKQPDVTAISHVWDLNDAPSGYSLAFTYPRSPYLERVKQRVDLKKPLILDLAMKLPDIPVSKSIYASWLRKDRGNWTSLGNPPIPQLFDSVDPECGLESETYSLKAAVKHFESEKTREVFTSLCVIGADGISSGLDEKNVQRLIHFLADELISTLVQNRSWEDLFAIFGEERLPVFVRLTARNRIEESILAIAMSNPGLVAKATLEREGYRLTKRLAIHDNVDLDGLLSKANNFASELPEPKARIAAANWTLFGTRVIRIAWSRLSNSLGSGFRPSQFYRRIVDSLIPLARVHEAHRESETKSTVSSNDEEDLRLVLVHAWSSVSKRIRTGTEQNPVCKYVIDELLKDVAVSESLDSLQRLVEHEQNTN